MTDKTARLDLRLSEPQKDLLEQAAELSGSTLSGFAIAHLMEAASEAVSRARVLTLDPASYDEFIAALDAPDDAAWTALRAMTPVWDR
jgi:uncharacterized protein (DUF1778 family)